MGFLGGEDTIDTECPVRACAVARGVENLRRLR
jgi:hypothetical protein